MTMTYEEAIALRWTVRRGSTGEIWSAAEPRWGRPAGVTYTYTVSRASAIDVTIGRARSAEQWLAEVQRVRELPEPAEGLGRGVVSWEAISACDTREGAIRACEARSKGVRATLDCARETRRRVRAASECGFEG